MALENLFRGLDPRLIPYAAALYSAMLAADPTARVTSVRRSTAEQTRLYRRFLAGQAAFPVAPPGTSKHERGIAFDIVAGSRTLEAAGRIWESWGGRWGGRFKDPIHFEA
jgi:hypothetical protein